MIYRCCICKKIYSIGEFANYVGKAKPDEPEKTSHGYCPKCYEIQKAQADEFMERERERKIKK